MKFFQNSVLNKHLKAQDSHAIKVAYKEFAAYFHNPDIQQNIREAKEEQFQEGFLRELFVKVLGYTLNPSPSFNLTTEHKNVKDSKKADGAIILPREHAPTVIAVIELKGTETTDLNRIEAQAFGYKNNQPECVYVITSNFEKLRFYIDNAIENIEFNLFTLTEKDFELLWLCLAFVNIEKNLAKRIKDESVSQEDVITKNLYNDYSLFKRELHQNLVVLNPDHDPLTLFKKSQKLLDRFLFLFFAEDRQLLPPNSVRLILDDWRDLQDRDVEIALYSRFKKYFEYLNTGFKGKRYDVFAYNGGLFKTDELLDGLKIDDELLYRHAMKLSTYDFVSEVDVNILGHIFENSLNELDEIKAQLEGQQVDKSKSKRKKDGVFYTPKYITKYIVDNTVGKLCIEKKAEIGLIEQEYITDRKRNIKTKQPLFEKLTAYRNWLLQLTICDPACGSGAFLNQALDFLINEHRYIDELQAKLLGSSLVLSDFEKNILENNLFGVDLNEESVEIAKLSLWLRTAQPNRKLNDLNNNIKCGNSLIDDPAVAGDKAFNWQEEFPTIFPEKAKKAWHITTATHNSRYSQRMFENHVQVGDPVWLTEKEEIIVTETIAKIVIDDKLNVLAYNICGDHMHLVLVCDDEELPSIMQKIKSMSARACNIAMGRTIPNQNQTMAMEHAPSPGYDERGTTQFHLWTQKYGSKEIVTEEQLNNTISYIQNNRIKHQLSNDGTCSIAIEAIAVNFTCSISHAFRTEYKGGFDVVIGNPPYVRAENIDKVQREYIISNNSKYTKTFGRFDLYIVFNELAISILKNNAFLSFIFPSSFFNQNYSSIQRDWFLNELNLIEIVDLSQIDVFKGVAVETAIIIVRNQPPSEYIYSSKPSNEFEFLQGNKSLIEKTLFNNLPNKTFRADFNDIKVSLIKKILENSDLLDSFCYTVIGAVPHNSITGASKDRLIGLTCDGPSFKNYIEGKNVNRYSIIWDGRYINYIPSEMHRPKFPELFENDKLLVRNISTSEGLLATFDNEHFYVNDTMSVLIPWVKLINVDQRGLNATEYQIELSIETDLKYILALINSKLLNFYFKQILSSNLHVYPEAIRNLPIRKSNSNIQQSFIYNANQLLTLTKELQIVSQKFQHTIQRKFNLDDLPGKLQNWYLLTYAEFIAELAKKKVKLSLSDEAEWEAYFLEEAKQALALKSEIDKTDKDIDRMVYELYGLTEEEIGIVEGAN